MSPKLQASLLRALQEGTFTRLGSTTPRHSDFRLICATNRPLESEVNAHRFRADLYYRINVIPLRIPPLRDRPEDIMPLALYFLGHYNRKFNRTLGPFTPEAANALEAAPWPGNVRELKHAIERVAAVKLSGAIAPGDLAMNGAIADAKAVAPRLVNFRSAREAFEREYFSRLLAEAGGNISEAARLSGMARQNLYPHLKRLGLVTES